MAGRLAGQTINDRLLAAKHSIAGQGLAKSVCKATTEEMIGPKKKHLDYLVQCTNEPNVSIPQLANLLIERSQNTNWVVVYKALITVHHMMCYGNERFTQYLASSNSTFQLSSFLDKSGVQGMLSVRAGYDMSPFIRRYSGYLNEKALSYRTVAFDFCKKRSNEDGMLRTMHTDKLLKTLPALQGQLDALLEFDCSANDLTNGVINMCFMLLFRDLIRLFACYNNGIINLLEKFFDMNKKQCREALDIYKKFLVRMDRVGEFLKVAENVGIDKGDIPDLTKAPSSLLEALEQHLAAIEGKKTSTSSTPSQSASNQKNVRSAVTALSSTSSSFGTVVANGRIDSQANGIDESLKMQALAEEEAAINQFKTKVQSPLSSANNPFFANNTTSHMTASHANHAVDLFAPQTSKQQKPSDDLLQLTNPFVDMFSQPQSNTVAFLPNMPQPNSAWVSNGNGYAASSNVQNGAFVSESNFQNVFGNADRKTADGIDQTTPSFNPFLVDDPLPSLLIIDSPKHKPILDVISFFQKDDSKENTINRTSSTDVKSTNKLSVDESLNLNNSSTGINDKTSCVTRMAPPKRPPPPVIQPATHNIPCETPTNPENPSFITANEDVSMSQNIDFDSMGGVLQPTFLQDAQAVPQTNISNNVPGSALLTGDLESSLASLAENLSINSRPPPVKEIQWNSPKNGSKVSSSWTPQPISATTGAGYKPMNQSMNPTQSQPAMQQQMFPPLQPMMATHPMVATTMMPQRQGMPVPPTAANLMGPQQSLLFH